MALTMKSCRYRYVTPWSPKEVHYSFGGMLINVHANGRRHIPQDNIRHCKFIGSIWTVAITAAYQTVRLFSSSCLLDLFIYLFSSYLYFTFRNFSHVLRLVCPKCNVLDWSNCTAFSILLLLTDWLTDWLADWLADCQNVWLSVCLTDYYYQSLLLPFSHVW